MVNIVITDAETVFDSAVTPQALGFDNSDGRYRLIVYPSTAPSELAQRISDADIVLCNRTRIGAEDMDAAPSLKLICVFATGYDRIDIEAARARKIAVCNVPGYSTESVAQHTVALMLALTNRICEASAVPAGQAELSRLPIPRICLRGRKLGIIGLGNIGRRVAELALAFGMEVLAVSRSPKQVDGVRLCSIDRVLSESDIVSVHCPLTEQTRGLIDGRAIAAMKDGAMLINTARGAIVDEAALAHALHTGKLGGAAVDVTEIEPAPDSYPLRRAPNCIMTPHVAWACNDSRRELMARVHENAEAFLRGERLNRVD